MPWHVTKSAQCPTGRPWAVIKDAGGDIEGCHETKEEAMDQMAALYADEDDGARIDRVKELTHAADRDLRRYVPFTVESVRASGSPEKKNRFYVRGQAAVFNRWSLDLGGFRERILPGAFDTVLRDEPHVLHVIDHDTSKVLSSTANGTLKLEADEDALHYDSTVNAKRTYAADLLENLQDGLVTQSSFAFTVPADGSGEEWRIADDGVVERTVTKVDGLYDVTTCAMGAYSMTTAALAIRSAAQPDKLGRHLGGATTPVAPEGVGGEKEVAPAESAGTPQTATEAVADKAEIEQLKRESAEAVRIARERLHRRRQS